MRAEPRSTLNVDQTLLPEKTLHKKFAKVGYTGASIFLVTGGNTPLAISAMALTTLSELTLRKEKALAQTESLFSLKTVYDITKTIAYSLIAKIFFSSVILTLDPGLFEVEEPLQSGINEAFSDEDKYFIYAETSSLVLSIFPECTSIIVHLIIAYQIIKKAHEFT